MRARPRQEIPQGKPMSAENQIYPHWPPAEKAILSIFFQYPERLDEVPNLSEAHFHLPAHREIFKAIRAIGKELTEADSLNQVILHLHAKGLLDRAGGPAT